MTITEWKLLAESEQLAIASTWSPYEFSDNDPFLKELVIAFRKAFPNYDIPGLGDVFGSLMLVVMRPFIFDKRNAPRHFMGLGIRYTISDSSPPGFGDHTNYFWAPENYLNFVDNNAAEIREGLGDSGMDREEMLAALVGMPFDDWIEACRRFGPGHTHMVPGQRKLGWRWRLKLR